MLTCNEAFPFRMMKYRLDSSSACISAIGRRPGFRRRGSSGEPSSKSPPRGPLGPRRWAMAAAVEPEFIFKRLKSYRLIFISKFKTDSRYRNYTDLKLQYLKFSEILLSPKSFCGTWRSSTTPASSTASATINADWWRSSWRWSVWCCWTVKPNPETKFHDKCYLTQIPTIQTHNFFQPQTIIFLVHSSLQECLESKSEMLLIILNICIVSTTKIFLYISHSNILIDKKAYRRDLPKGFIKDTNRPF